MYLFILFHVIVIHIISCDRLIYFTSITTRSFFVMLVSAHFICIVDMSVYLHYFI